MEKQSPIIQLIITFFALLIGFTIGFGIVEIVKREIIIKEITKQDIGENKCIERTEYYNGEIKHSLLGVIKDCNDISGYKIPE